MSLKKRLSRKFMVFSEIKKTWVRLYGVIISMAIYIVFPVPFLFLIIHEEFNNHEYIIVLAVPMNVSIDCVNAAMIYIVDICRYWLQKLH